MASSTLANGSFTVLEAHPRCFADPSETHSRSSRPGFLHALLRTTTARSVRDRTSSFSAGLRREHLFHVCSSNGSRSSSFVSQRLHRESFGLRGHLRVLCEEVEDCAFGCEGSGSWVLRKRRWELGNVAQQQFLPMCCAGKGSTQEFTATIPAESVAIASSPDSGGSGFGIPEREERLFAKEKHDFHQEDYPGDSSENAQSGRAHEATNYTGVQPVRGRFEARLQNDKIVRTLIFSSQKEAAKAYDKSAYKLGGDSAKTNFELTDEEKLEVKQMDWEDLVLRMQLQVLSQSSPSRFGFPGVCYNDEERAWQVSIRHKNQAYVGLYPSINEASKVYDLAAYKLQGTDALLSSPLLSGERMDLINTDWGSLTVRLGLTARAPRRRRTSECHGVRLRPSGNWLASFSHKGYYFYLGTFISKAAAAKTYDLFAFKLLGENAKLNSELLPEEKDFLSRVSVFSLRNHLASQALVAPKILHLGARGARLVQGQWEVCLESSRKDRIYTSLVSTEQEALKVHDLAVHKLHNGMGRTYGELTLAERHEIESTDWKSVVSKFHFQQMPSYRGVNRLVSGAWQSYIRHGGAYLVIATFDSAETAARASDKCQYKLQGKNAIFNFPLSGQQKRDVDAVDWDTLVASIRAEQSPSPVLTELGETSTISSLDISVDKKWILLLCHEQLLQQQMARRAPKAGRQMVVANPSLAAQFSCFNRRADESPMLVEEVMEGSNTPLLWQCPCGNVLLKSPMGLLKTTQVVCKRFGCSIIPPTPRRMGAKKTSVS